MAAMIALSPIPPAARAVPGQADVKTAAAPAVFYLVLAVVFIWLGIGSIRARRWAWALTVILSWLWLILGVFGTAGLALFGSGIRASMMQQGNISLQMATVIMVVTGAILGCMYFILPGLFLLFYQRASVRATCQWRDPKVRWTDRCPMPVLALSMLLAGCAMWMLPSAVAYRFVVPVFGVFLSGAAGAAVVLPLTFLWAWLAWRTYRLKIGAWWATLRSGSWRPPPGW